MKFKNFIKNHIQRISVVILCMILMFTLSITAFAMDGEVGGLDKELLNEYVSDAYVFYNPSNLPIYSPFNKDVLYYDFKWPVPSEETVFQDKEYVALTVDDGSGFYYVYYVVPESFKNNSFTDIILNLFDGTADYPDIYYELFCKNATDNGTTLTMNSSYTQVKLFNDSSLIWGNIDFAETLNGYVYCVQLSKDQTILSSSEIYYGEYGDCFGYLPRNNICQVYYHSSKSISNSNHGNYEPQLVKANNLNYLVSVSTYSITAYDYFDNDSVSSLVSNFDIEFTYSLPFSASQYRFYVPESIRGSNYPEGTDYLYYSSDSPYYYLTEGYLTTERPYLILPATGSFGSRKEDSNYVFVFPEDTTPIIYFRVHKVSNGVIDLQVLSKVDYELYAGGQFLGSFDAETTTYHCNYVGTDVTAHIFAVYDTPSYGNLSTMISGTDYNIYPYLRTAYYTRAGQYFHYFHLNGLYGCKTTVSLFPSNAGTMGFYTYISPDIKEEVSSGNTGVPGGSIVPGERPGGGGNYQPPFDSDLDWQKFWEFTIDYDSMKSDAFNGYELTPYPDLPFKSLDGINLFTIPDDLLDYMVSCIQWYGDNLNSFIDYVGGPVGKMLTMMRMIFENCPDVLKFLFMLFFFFFAAMKIMQFDTAYLLAQSSSDVYTGILVENEVLRKRNEKLTKENEKKAKQQELTLQREKKERIVETNRKMKRQSSWKTYSNSIGSTNSMKEHFDKKFGSKDGE